MLKNLCLIFLIKKILCFIMKFTTVLENRIKTKKIHRLLEFNQLQWLKAYIEFNTQKKIKAEKNKYKDGKALYKLMNKAIFGNTIQNVRNKIDIKLKKDHLKYISKPSYMSHKIFGNNLVAISKSKLLELSKVLK